MFDLKSKIILITGGAGLLGSRLAEVILSNNGIPVILDNNTKKIKPEFICLKLPDGVHLSKKGTRIYSKIVYKELKKFL